MPGLSFPDVNVWMALLLSEHNHHRTAKAWWQSDNSDAICFIRVTQISVLRLLTTSTVMNGKPLSMKAAWRAYDRLFRDDRVSYMAEVLEMDQYFRRFASDDVPSPKIWADSWLLAVAEVHQGTVITFDTKLALRADLFTEGRCRLLSQKTH